MERRVAELRRGAHREENFRWLFERYYRPLASFFVNRGLALSAAEDLTQEVFLRVYRSIDKFREEASFETWLFRVARNCWLKEVRREKAQKREAAELSLEEVMTGDSPAAVPVSAGGGGGPDLQEQTLVRERKIHLRRAIGNLPPQMRRCLILRLVYGLKYREIAIALQISIDAVKSHLNQGRRRVQLLMRRDFR